MSVQSHSARTSQLAIDGGQPVREQALAPWPQYADDEVERVADVLRSGAVNYWTGTEGRAFEEEFGRYMEGRRALTVANGTAALELALRILGIGTGDEVIVTPRSFFASGSTILQCGATPIFVDVDRDSQNITAETIAPAITAATRAIVAVHLAGWPSEMQPILDLAGNHGLKVIEDCAQAHGARYRGRPVGCFGDVAAFSFCQDKIISTCGEGGMLVMDDEELWQAAWAYRDHGKAHDAVYERQHTSNFRWVHESVGTNWRMTEPQAAVGRLQLEKLDGWVERRRCNANVLRGCFSQVPALRTTSPGADEYHSYYRYYVFVRPEWLAPGWSRDRIISAVQAEGIPCGSGSCPEIYLEKACVDAKTVPLERLAAARELGETSLAFVVHPTLGQQDMADIGRAVEKVLAAAMS